MFDVSKWPVWAKVTGIVVTVWVATWAVETFVPESWRNAVPFLP